MNQTMTLRMRTIPHSFLCRRLRSTAQSSSIAMSPSWYNTFTSFFLLISIDKSSYINKQRTLMLCSRGVSHRDRHFMKDLLDLMPHSKKDSKLDTKNSLASINELAEMKACSSCIFLEARKRQDLYMWISKTPNGPCAKFLVQNSLFLSLLVLPLIVSVQFTHWLRSSSLATV